MKKIAIAAALLTASMSAWPASAPGPHPAVGTSIRSRLVRLSYKFGGPVVARY